MTIRKEVKAHKGIFLPLFFPFLSERYQKHTYSRSIPRSGRHWIIAAYNASYLCKMRRNSSLQLSAISPGQYELVSIHWRMISI